MQAVLEMARMEEIAPLWSVEVAFSRSQLRSVDARLQTRFHHTCQPLSKQTCSLTNVTGANLPNTIVHNIRSSTESVRHSVTSHRVTAQPRRQR